MEVRILKCAGRGRDESLPLANRWYSASGMCDESLEILIRRAADGESTAADQLAQRYQDEVRARIHRRMGPELRARVETDDIFQSSFFAAIGELKGFRYEGERAFVMWLSRIAERKLLMTVRHHRAAKRDLRLEWPLEGARAVMARGTSPTQGAVRNELREGLRRAVSELPDPDREVVTLHTFGGLGFKEVAERVGLADKNAARWVFQRALKRLGELMDGE